MGFVKPSKVQERALPLLLHNPPRNLVGQGQSGTGKTAAFTLNILTRLDLSSEQMQNTPQALILAPTRELARQIEGVVRIMGCFVEGLKIATAVPQQRSQRITKYDFSVIVGTPGTVQECIKRRQMNAQHLKVLVVDEADNMLDQSGLGDQCNRVRKYVNLCESLCLTSYSLLIFHQSRSQRCPDLSLLSNISSTCHSIRRNVRAWGKSVDLAA